MGGRSTLGALEELMLLAVLRLGPDADGAGVRTELAEEADRPVSISTVYVTLMRLEEKGYAASWKGDPSGERGGKARRMYEVTPEGMAALDTVRDARARLRAGVEQAVPGGSRG